MSHRHAAFRSRDPYGEDEGPNTCWVMFFGMIGLGLLLTGLEYGYSSFSDPRAKAIVPYNRAVDAWNNGLRQQMQESEFSYRAYSPRAVKIDVPEKTCEEGELHCNPVKAHNETRYEDVEPTDEAVASIPWIAFKPVVRNDSLSHDQIMSDLHKYVPLHFEAHGMLPASVPGHWDMDKQAWTGPAYKFQVRAVHKGEETVVALAPAVAYQEVHIGANQKMCRLHHGNNFHSGRCWERLAFNGACLQLALVEGKWARPTYKDAQGKDREQLGCTGNTEILFRPSCPGNGYHRILGSDPACDFSLANATIRSNADPYVQAGIMTGGTYAFGDTPHEVWVQGIIMIVVGTIMLCPVIPVLLVNCSRRRAAYASRMRTDSWLDPVTANARARSAAVSVSSSRSATPPRAGSTAMKYMADGEPAEAPAGFASGAYDEEAWGPQVVREQPYIRR